VTLSSILKLVRSIPILDKCINRFLTNKICSATRPRPRSFSLWSHLHQPDPNESPQQEALGEYTSWPMLTNRHYSARHLPPVSEDYIADLRQDDTPIGGKLGEITNLFMCEGEMMPGRSTTLFMFFAQWFTDSILRVDSADRRKNTSNHNIDLC
jgi:prostaglandin-endoperoxide synthase 2